MGDDDVNKDEDDVVDDDVSQSDLPPSCRTKQLWEAASSSVWSVAKLKSASQTKTDEWAGLDTKGILPNSLLATIPTSELGESLDCRPERTAEVGLSRSAPVSAHSLGEVTTVV